MLKASKSHLMSTKGELTGRSLSALMWKRGMILGLCMCMGFTGMAQDVTVVPFRGLQERLENNTEPVLLVNFWATWCGPCVKELPHFKTVVQAYAEQGVAALFVSLDFSEELDASVKPFLARQQLPGQVILLDDVDYNSWLPKLSEQWSGAIPATFLFGPGGKQLYFHEGELTEEQLRGALDIALNQY